MINEIVLPVWDDNWKEIDRILMKTNSRTVLTQLELKLVFDYCQPKLTQEIDQLRPPVNNNYTNSRRKEIRSKLNGFPHIVSVWKILFILIIFIIVCALNISIRNISCDFNQIKKNPFLEYMREKNFNHELKLIDNTFSPICNRILYFEKERELARKEMLAASKASFLSGMRTFYISSWDELRLIHLNFIYSFFILPPIPIVVIEIYIVIALIRRKIHCILLGTNFWGHKIPKENTRLKAQINDRIVIDNYDGEFIIVNIVKSNRIRYYLLVNPDDGSKVIISKNTLPTSSYCIL